MRNKFVNTFLINLIFKFLNIFDYLKLEKIKIRLENFVIWCFCISGAFNKKQHVAINSVTKNRRASFLLLSPRIIQKVYWYLYKLGQEKTSANLPAPKYLSEASFNNCLNEFKEKGITKWPKSFKSVLSQKLVNNLRDKTGMNQTITLSFDHELSSKTILDTDICLLISHYYSNQSFFREEPTISHKSVLKKNFNKPDSYMFHSDGFRQVSVMLLLNDLNDKNVHMEYAIKSHSQQQIYERRFLDQENLKKKYKIKKLVGKKGDLFIFDAEGLHRGVYGKNGKERLIFHLNFHPGTYCTLKKSFSYLIPKSISKSKNSFKSFG